MEKTFVEDNVLSIKTVNMGSILTEKIPWLMNDPRTITKNTKKSYIYIS